MAVVFAFALLNLVAWRHAHAMTHFIPIGTRTPRADRLDRWERLGVLATGVSIPRPTNHISPADAGMRHRTLVLTNQSGIQLEAWVIPGANSGPFTNLAVLLFHGYGGSKDSLLEPAKAFHELGCSTWLLDFRGSGGSEGESTSIGWHEAEDVAALFRVARAEDTRKRVVLWGASMGAAAVLRTLHLGSVQPEGLVLESPYNRLLDTAANRFRLMGLPAFPFAHLLVFWGGVDMGFDGFELNPADYARNVKCPAVILSGALDKSVTVAQAQEIAASLGGWGKLELVPDAGHESFLNRDPLRWHKAVEELLAKVSR